MRLDLQRSAMAGGGRTLRRADSSPRPAALCRSDSIRKKKKRSKRSRISAALRELGMAAKAARDKDGLLQLLVTGHRRGRRGSGGDGGDGRTPAERGVAAGPDDDLQRASRLGFGGGAGHAQGPGKFERPDTGTSSASGTGRRRCASWVLAVALVLALACVVAFGKAPAICCCTCAAWLCGGAEDRASESSVCQHRSGARRGSATCVVQPRAGGTSSNTSTPTYTVTVPCSSTSQHTG